MCSGWLTDGPQRRKEGAIRAKKVVGTASFVPPYPIKAKHAKREREEDNEVEDEPDGDIRDHLLDHDHERTCG
jgi:hypothetical protein